MGLLDYGDSDSSSDEEQPKQQAKATTKPATAAKPGTASKPAFQKVVDRSNPHKIRVDLGSAGKTAPGAAEEDDLHKEERPAKKPRLGGGLNAFLPAPKKANPPPNAAPASSSAAGGAPKVGSRLGSGVSLKTSAAPGFSREAYVEEAEDNEAAVNGGEAGGSADGAQTDPPKEFKKQGNAMMFRPMSVSRKPKKKKPAAPLAPAAATPIADDSPAPVPQKKKVSMFSFEARDSENSIPAAGGSGYEPLLYNTKSSEASNEPAEQQPAEPATSASEPATLSSLADTLNLPEHEKRKLFGRKARDVDLSAVNIVSFDADAEWRSNEAARVAGEQDGAASGQGANAVRAIAPGRHSLRQLVNAVSSQKDALEEQFAANRRSKKEAGSRYGW